MKPYHTHGKDDYGTPKPLFDLLNQEFHLTLDVCADAENTKCDQFLTKEMDALTIDWWGRVFMNPPFSLLDKFLAKLVWELMAGHIELAVAIIAARSDTQAMFMASSYAGETRFLKGRVSYLVYPTDWQRNACGSMSEFHIEDNAWAGLVKEIGLPKMAIQALIKDPTIPGGHESLAQSAPFPSTVLIFDKRPQQSTVYWDWKKKVKTAYVFQGKDPKKLPWENIPKIPGNLLLGKGGVFHTAEPPKSKSKKLLESIKYTGDGKPQQKILFDENAEPIYPLSGPGAETLQALKQLNDLINSGLITDDKEITKAIYGAHAPVLFKLKPGEGEDVIFTKDYIPGAAETVYEFDAPDEQPLTGKEVTEILASDFEAAGVPVIEQMAKMETLLFTSPKTLGYITGINAGTDDDNDDDKENDNG